MNWVVGGGVEDVDWRQTLTQQRVGGLQHQGGPADPLFAVERRGGATLPFANGGARRHEGLFRDMTATRSSSGILMVTPVS